MYNDTIIAISTAMGEGAIGIVRLSGSTAFEIADKMFSPFSKSNTFENKRMVYGQIYDNDRIVDEVLLVKMFGPKTYTCEDIVEVYCHGGIVPLRAILALGLKLGARMAEPGEFTQRAFLNGRIDLAQAESVMDLISAKTSKSFDLAMKQLEGFLSLKVKALRNSLIHLMASVEVSIDYPEEDIEEITYKTIENELRVVKSELENLISKSESGKIIREGLKTVIVGKPNVGKSSLMNALLKESRAIVTEVPGTTRDVIEELLNVSGITIKLIDTAGIRETNDIVEKIGVERSKLYFNEADLIIFVLNASEALTEEDFQIIDLVKDKHALVIINKTDLDILIDEEYIMTHLHDKKIIKTSMEKHYGIEEIESSISEIVFKNKFSLDDKEILSNERHIHLIQKTYSNINEALNATVKQLPYDFIEVDIKEAIVNLGNITGESVSQDLLNNIFSNFCLGK